MNRFQTTAGLHGGTLDGILHKGIFAGFVASAAMGLVAMVTSATYLGRGFYTPAYHVAFVMDPNTMVRSLEKAAEGERFYFSQEAFLFGMAGHIVVAGALGALFAFVAAARRWQGRQALTGGVAFGLAVMAVMSIVVLPAAGALSGAGDPISRMGSEIGWPTFAVLHVIFGLVLGAWLLIRPQDLDV